MQILEGELQSLCSFVSDSSISDLLQLQPCSGLVASLQAVQQRSMCDTVLSLGAESFAEGRRCLILPELTARLQDQRY